MLSSKKETLEDSVAKLCLQGPVQIKDLQTKLVASGKKASLRGVYKAVDVLIDAGVLIKTGKQVWVDQEWLGTLRSTIAKPLPELGRNERVIYKFSSMAHLDTFWKTIMVQLEELEHDGQIFFYNPHNFWAYMPERKASENAYYASFVSNKKHAYFTLGGTTSADLEFKRTYQNDFLQIDMRMVPSFSRRDHVTILGDYVLTARLSEDFSSKLDQLYASGRPTGELVSDIILLCEKTRDIKLIFEYTPAKARKLRKLLSPNFYFPNR